MVGWQADSLGTTTRKESLWCYWSCLSSFLTLSLFFGCCGSISFTCSHARDHKLTEETAWILAVSAFVEIQKGPNNAFVGVLQTTYLELPGLLQISPQINLFFTFWPQTQKWRLRISQWRRVVLGYKAQRKIEFFRISNIAIGIERKVNGRPENDNFSVCRLLHFHMVWCGDDKKKEEFSTRAAGRKKTGSKTYLQWNNRQTDQLQGTAQEARNRQQHCHFMPFH